MPADAPTGTPPPTARSPSRSTLGPGQDNCEFAGWTAGCRPYDHGPTMRRHRHARGFGKRHSGRRSGRAAALRLRRRGLFHRPHSHALARTGRMSAPGRSRRRAGLPHRSVRALVGRARRDRPPCASRHSLLDAACPPRSRAADPPARADDDGRFRPALPGAANPIALSRVALVGVGDTWIDVRGLDCMDATPLIDIKPELCPNASLASLRP